MTLPLVFDRSTACRHSSGSWASPSAVATTPPPLSCPGRKFIDGLPMNPATNRFTGWS